MRALFLVPLLALAACDTTNSYDSEDAVVVDGVVLATDRSVYGVGDEATLTLRNRGRRTAETGALGCAGVERRTAGGWTQDVAFNQDRYCIAILHVVSPGDEIEAAVPLDGIEAGTYRFVHEVNDRPVATAAFSIR